jgi:hypothetical protein
MSPGTFFVDAEHVVEVGGEDALKVLGVASVDLTKVTKATPAALAALAVLLGQVSAGVTATQTAATGGFTLALDQAAWTSIKAVWPDVVSLVKDLGINI